MYVFAMFHCLTVKQLCGSIVFMNIEYLIGILVSDGSLTGDKKQPCISVRMRDTRKELLELLATNFGGKIYGPYSAGTSSHAKGDIYQVMWRGKPLSLLLSELDKLDLNLYDPYFGKKYVEWRKKYDCSS